MTEVMRRSGPAAGTAGTPVPPGAPGVEILDELDRLEELAPAWDALAVSAMQPRCAPAWTLAWYRHALPADGAVRVVVVTDADGLVGVCPLYVVRTGFGFYRYAVAAPILNGVEPIARPGREDEVGEAIGAALAGADPTPDVIALDWAATDSPFPSALQRGWPRPHPAVVRGPGFPALRIVHPGSDFDAWLAARSAKFRKVFRSDWRKLESAGFEHRVSTTSADILERLPALQRLYEVRRHARAGAGAGFDATFAAVVADAVAASDAERVTMFTLERPGAVIAAGLVVSAGGQSSAWLSGFDEMWAHLGPARVNLALTVQESMRRGDTVLDLGSGGQSYKYRFTEDAITRHHVVLARRGLRPFHGPAQLVPFEARQRAARMVGRLAGTVSRRRSGSGPD